ncbi:hypothetical protein [Jiangella asiatica]|uniref:hypothetical protein n=1 Tax=Jiangella asiatica TaxID=2530372 RepID=UPI00193CCAA3|nr:hypothetical protein [Jiangella asiatica]
MTARVSRIRRRTAELDAAVAGRAALGAAPVDNAAQADSEALVGATTVLVAGVAEAMVAREGHRAPEDGARARPAVTVTARRVGGRPAGAPLAATGAAVTADPVASGDPTATGGG